MPDRRLARPAQEPAAMRIAGVGVGDRGGYFLPGYLRGFWLAPGSLEDRPENNGRLAGRALIRIGPSLAPLGDLREVVQLVVMVKSPFELAVGLLLRWKPTVRRPQTLATCSSVHEQSASVTETTMLTPRRPTGVWDLMV
jgi:hypothetical protein